MEMNSPYDSTGMDADHVVRLRTAIMRLSRYLRKASTGEGLTDTQSSVLMKVVRHDSMTMGELAEAEGLNPTMLSRVVGHLEEADLLQRIKDPVDRRAIQVNPTTQGRRLVQRIKDRRTQQLISRLKLLDGEELSRLLHALPALEMLAGIEEPPI